MYAQLLNDILTNILYKLCRCWYRPTHPELHKGTLIPTLGMFLFCFTGFARKKTKPEKPLVLGGTCKSHKTKLMIHFCDRALTTNGAECTIKCMYYVLWNRNDR